MAIRHPMYRRWQNMIIAALTAVGSMLPASSVVLADVLKIIPHELRILHLPDRVGTIVVGDPLIADVSLQSLGQLVITGNNYGCTNITVLDYGGSVLMETVVLVEDPVDNQMRPAEKDGTTCSMVVSQPTEPNVLEPRDLNSLCENAGDPWESADKHGLTDP